MSLSGVAGVLAGLGLTAGGFALLLGALRARIALLRALPPPCAAPGARRCPCSPTPASPCCCWGWPTYFLGAGAVKNFAAALLISVLCALAVLVLFSRFLLGNGLRLARESVHPQGGSGGDEAACLDAAAADRARGADRGGAGDAAVRRGPARRAWTSAAARCCATRWARNSPLKTWPPRRARPAWTPIRWSRPKPPRRNRRGRGCDG